jgi:hypothetical protein
MTKIDGDVYFIIARGLNIFVLSTPVGEYNIIEVKNFPGHMNSITRMQTTKD